MVSNISWFSEIYMLDHNRRALPAEEEAPQQKRKNVSLHRGDSRWVGRVAKHRRGTPPPATILLRRLLGL
jgi:hypothetical protein